METIRHYQKDRAGTGTWASWPQVWHSLSPRGSPWGSLQPLPGEEEAGS